jgi:Dirigent-like protein
MIILFRLIYILIWSRVCTNILILYIYRHKGSSLLVVGQLPYTSDWTQVAIVGGTGQFTMAQGVVYGRKLDQDDKTFEIIELFIHAFYSPMQRPVLPN